MKINFLSLLFFVCTIANAQTIPCTTIERTLVGKQRGKLVLSSEYNDKAKPGFKVNEEPHKFGLFYGTLKPYVFCTQEALPEFKKGVMFSKLKTFAIVGGIAISYFLDDTRTTTSAGGKTNYLPLIACSTLFIASIPLYFLQKSHIKKSIAKHNASLH